MPLMLLTRTVGALATGIVALASTGCVPGLGMTRTVSIGLRDGPSSKALVKKSGLSAFMRDLKSPRSGQQYFSVAVDGSKLGCGPSEVWLDGLKVVGNSIEGRLVPGSGRTCRIVKVSQSDVCDWMIVEGGRVKGGATLKD